MAVRHVLTILAVRDVRVSAAFYAAAFGWNRVVDAPVYAEFALPGGQRFGVYDRDGFARNTGALPCPVPAGATSPAEVYLHVDGDLAAAVDRALAAGARVLSPLAPRDWGDDAAYLADPDGHVLVLATPRPS